ncbi:MAG: hypothetical protein FH762_12860 [Firmicutes bacterium]|nr:hypothetical protein [Bacillota bacterium]
MFELLNLNTTDTTELKKFFSEWDVKKINLYTGEKKKEIGIADIYNKNNILNQFKREIKQMRRAVSLWLRIDNSQKNINDISANGNFEESYFKKYDNITDITPSGRFKLLNYDLVIPTKISITPIFTMSEPTKRKCQKNLADIQENIKQNELEIKKLEENLKEDILNENTPEKGPFGLIGNPQIKKYNTKIQSLVDENDILRKRYALENSRGWKMCTLYEVTDIISLCWLEILLFIQNNINARRCSLCGKLFIIYSRKSNTRCPECGENGGAASKQHREKNKMIKKIIKELIFKTNYR